MRSADSSTALLRRAFAVLVREVMAKRREQKSAELSALTIRHGDAVVFQKRKNKTLGEILRILGSMPPPARKMIKRSPILPTQIGQRLLAIRLRRRTGANDAAPTRGRKCRGRKRRSAFRCFPALHSFRKFRGRVISLFIRSNSAGSAELTRFCPDSHSPSSEANASCVGRSLPNRGQ